MGGTERLPIGRIVDLLSTAECGNFFAACGYDPDWWSFALNLPPLLVAIEVPCVILLALDDLGEARMCSSSDSLGL